MSEEKVPSFKEFVFGGTFFLIFIGSYLYLIKIEVMNAVIMGHYLVIIYGFHFVHSFIWKRNMYMTGFTAEPIEKYKIQRFFLFFLGLLMMFFGVKYAFEHGI
jgi:hypothetical protein